MTRPQQPDSTTNVDSNVDNDSVSLSGRRDLNPRPPEPHFGAGVPDVRHDAGLSSESAEVHPTAPPVESGSAETQRGQQRGQAPDDARAAALVARATTRTARSSDEAWLDIATDLAGKRSGAIFSDCRRYRYALWREWEAGANQLVVIGLNPSTADEEQDDPTIRRCVGFAKALGLGKLVMLNLFAFRATKPKDCFAAIDPVGVSNDAVLRTYATDLRTAHVVAAWGAHGTPERVAEVASIFGLLMCWGRNANGSPKHPLYLPSASELVTYREAGLPAKGNQT